RALALEAPGQTLEDPARSRRDDGGLEPAVLRLRQVDRAPDQRLEPRPADQVPERVGEALKAAPHGPRDLLGRPAVLQLVLHDPARHVERGGARPHPVGPPMLEGAARFTRISEGMRAIPESTPSALSAAGSTRRPPFEIWYCRMVRSCAVSRILRM